MRFFKKMFGMETRESLEDLLLKAGLLTKEITKEQAMNIPALSACVDVISNTIASIPIELYAEKDGKVIEIDDDRVKMLNDDTNDTLDAFQFKKALIVDYLLDGAGYAYINRKRNEIKSLHYVSNQAVSVNINTDPIFKSYDILVNGETYADFDFLKLTRYSTNGVTGRGIIEQNNKLLSVAYNTLVFEEALVKTGGNKKGFLKSNGRLSKEAIEELKLAWKNLYQNNEENVVVLNNGLDFQEASNTSVEMQLNENKKTNSIEICKVLNVAPSVLDGKATDEEYNNFIKICILPILSAVITAINKDLLLPSEKNESFYFAFDTNELLKGDIEKRFRAYSEAVKAGWISKNEIRFMEDLEDIEGLDIVTLSLGEVVYDIKSKKYFTPNTDSITGSGMTKEVAMGGGDNNEN